MVNTKSIKLIFLLSVLFGSIGFMSSDLYLPSLPFIAKNLHASISLTQLSVAVFALGYGIARLFYGLVSDAFGRKKPLIFGLLFCLFGCLICLFSKNIYVLLAGRLIQGFGAGGSNILGRIILSDQFEGSKLAKYSSYYSMAGVSLLASAPLLGGYLQHYFDWQASFTFLSFYTFFALIMGIFILPETNKYRNREFLKPSFLKLNIKTLFTTQSFLVCVGVLFFTYGAMLAWLTAGPVVLQKVMGFTSVEFGWTAGAASCFYIVGAYCNGKFVCTFGMRKMIRFGTTLTFFSGLFMVLSAMLHYVNPQVFIIPLVVAVFGFSMINPNAYAAGLTPFYKIAGIAAAILGSIQILGGFIFSTIISVLPDNSQLPVGVVFLTSGFLIIILSGKLRQIK